MTVGERLLSLIAGPDAALFGVPGGQTLPLYAASKDAEVRHLVVRDERNAVTAADAYARLTGGAALGARLARSSGRVVALTGDGGWGYGLSETETAARYGLEITTVVLNNSSLAWIRHVESRMRVPYSTDFSRVDFAAAARAMGAAGFRIEDPGEVEATIAEAIETPGPSIVEVVVSAEATPIVRYGSVRRAAYG